MKTYGWFDYQSDPERVRNYLTGQSLTVSPSRLDPIGGTYHGTYSDADFSQEIKFVVRKPGESHFLEVVVDYNDVSANTWSYGHWRRVDDFLVDALLCRQEFLIRNVSLRLTAKGGWRSGAWNSQMRRNFSGRKADAPDQLVNYKAVEPYTVPLDLKPPLKWKLSPVAKPHTTATLRFDRLKDSNIPYLSRTSEIEGFQGLVPFLEREDRNAYVIFSKLQPSSHRGEDPETLLYYTYIDEEIFFTFRSHPSYHNELGTAIDYGFRELPPRRELWTIRPLGELVPWDTPRAHDNVLSKFSYLSYPVWLKIVSELGEAWSAWATPRTKVEIDSSINLSSNYGRVGKVGDYGPTMSHGFTAGMPNSWFELRFQDA